MTTGKAIFFIVLCTFFTSSGQVLWKLALKEVVIFNPLTWINLFFILGFVSYGLGLALMLLAFKGGEVTILYPILATSYVWVSMASPYFFPTDSMNLWKWLGVAVILVSVTVLSLGSKQEKVIPSD